METTLADDNRPCPIGSEALRAEYLAGFGHGAGLGRRRRAEVERPAGGDWSKTTLTASWFVSRTASRKHWQSSINTQSASKRNSIPRSPGSFGRMARCCEGCLRRANSNVN